ncbi:MAG: hypothetical protein M5R38_05530 [Candidatus Methylomirabilis sp.]|nr:hypothetical protein [Candidatus Methylomirabilis sp.]
MRLLTEANAQPSRYQVPDACALVIFGASGDLTRRKLLPAPLRAHARRLAP